MGDKFIVLQNEEILRCIQHFNSESIVQLVTIGPVQQEANQAENCIMHNAELTPFANVCDACVRAAQQNIDRNQRGRFNQPNGELTFDELTEKMTDLIKSMKIWSRQSEVHGQPLQEIPQEHKTRMKKLFKELEDLGKLFDPRDGSGYVQRLKALLADVESNRNLLDPELVQSFVCAFYNQRNQLLPARELVPDELDDLHHDAHNDA